MSLHFCFKISIETLFTGYFNAFIVKILIWTISQIEINSEADLKKNIAFWKDVANKAPYCQAFYKKTINYPVLVFKINVCIKNLTHYLQVSSCYTKAWSVWRYSCLLVNDLQFQKCLEEDVVSKQNKTN